MAGARFGALVLAAAVLLAVQAGPVPSTSQRIQETKELSKVAQVQLDQAEQRLQQARDALIKQLIVDVAHDQGIRGAVQAVRVEQRLEDEILTAARAARGHPQELQKLDQYVRRDKRALGLITSLLGGAGPVNRGPTYSAYIGGGASAFGPAKPSGGGFLTGILGSSSGLLGSSSGGGEGSTSPEDELTNGTPPGSDSGSILSLITPILGSLSGSSGGGGGGDSDGEGGGSSGSDSGSILSLVTPLLGSSSGNGYNDVPNTSDDNDGSSGASASASAGSDSGSILSLVTPLLGSSSGGGGGGGGGDESGDGGASAGGGSDSSAILGLVTPLLGSSSGGSGGSGGGGGDGGSSSGGGGSDLSSILGISNSGGGGGGSVSIGGGGGGNHLTEKLKILTDGVSLLLRVKFLIFRKLFGLIGGASG